MSNAFVFKAAAGMLVFAAAPTYCVYALMQFGKSGEHKGSFTSNDGEFRWDGPEALEVVKGKPQSTSIEVGPRSVARRVAAWMDKEK